MNNFLKENDKFLRNISIIAVSIIVTYVFCNYVFGYIAPFAIGWVLSLLYEPFVRFAQKKLKIRRKTASLIAVIVFLAFIFSFATWVILKLAYEARLFAYNLPRYINDLSAFVASAIKKLNAVIRLLPENLQPSLNVKNYGGIISPIIKSGGSGGVTFIKAVPGGALAFIMAIISSYFFSCDKKQISEFALSLTPPKVYDIWRLIKERSFSALSGYFKTQIILMAYVTVICGIGFFILKSPYALLLAVITGVIDALPFFGSGFILWPAAVISLIGQNYAQAVGYVIIYLLAQLMRQIAQPKILGDAIGIHPLLAIVSMYLGLKFIGVLGMIIGPAVAVTVKVFYTAAQEQIKR